MQQDANKIIDSISSEWSQDMANAKKKIAILAEENRLLKEELDRLTEQSKQEKAIKPRNNQATTDAPVEYVKEKNNAE
ncbi:hypothetical protein [Salicibibacter kimchii]|uniref:Uncharacterized protein n=1 Tax=Salicibibacter kimchii TaxID=2099786 RepID=A0A345BUK2_9BACI|nr:hypothetical protein [Salicibibacter kimchii]AXF54633.1 hypothetical protein DT065_00460 [Salicibibacter kimchii]